MNKNNFVYIFFDIICMLVGFSLTSIFIHESIRFFFPENYKIFLLFVAINLIISIVKTKYSTYQSHYRNFISTHFQSWLFSVIITIVALYIFYYTKQDNKILYIFFILVLVLQILVSNTIYFFKNAIDYSKKLEQEHISTIQNAIQNEQIQNVYKQIANDSQEMYNRLSEAISNEVFEFIKNQAFSTTQAILFLETINRFNVLQYQDSSFSTIVNISLANDIRRINKFFESVNIKLHKDGIFIQCVETIKQRKKRLLNKYPIIISHLIYSFDFVIHRILPRLPYIKNSYFMIFKGKSQRLSYAETLGRLYSCGFEHIADIEIDKITWFAVKKVSKPALSYKVTYGPIIKLKRLGKNGKIIWVYKFRTMHPYSEYLQEYIYKLNSLESGGKFKNDFRVSTIGRIFRKYWLDELPMLINFLKGELKFFGVRPLSEQYFNLYPEDYKQRRMTYKPGLIPPYYVHLPKTLNEIIDSEKKYLDLYDKYGFFVDFIYTFKVLLNIIFKKIRSS
jgi:lipopolysaccharide/colanic/teichoic acid biosynthesis glycosyltransferase/heme/copper-type cytochrome/quinol oxidase subunit 4